MEQGEIKTIIWDEHEPPKNYIWIHDSKSYEFDEATKEWKETEIDWSSFRFGNTILRNIVCDDNSTPPDNCIWMKEDKIYVNAGDDNWKDVTPVPPTPSNPTFAGLEIASGDLYHQDSNFLVSDNPYVNSYGEFYGLSEDGSSYFNWNECHEVNIEGFRLPTKSEWESIIGTSREGSTVNGRANSHFCLVKFEDEVGGFNNPNGLLLFPDGLEISGAELTTIDSNDSQTIGLTKEDIDNYISQGCAILLANSYYLNGDWNFGGDDGYYWSSTEDNVDDAYYLYFNDDVVYAGGDLDKSNNYYSVRLVKTTIQA